MQQIQELEYRLSHQCHGMARRIEFFLRANQVLKWGSHCTTYDEPEQDFERIPLRSPVHLTHYPFG